ncbi:hypothetical protein ABQF05_21580, partial [Xanthomonas campestris pv. campestris]
MKFYKSSVWSSAIVAFSILVSATFCGDAYDSEKVLDELVSLVAPEKPPITQRPQGLDVCSGVPELP